MHLSLKTISRLQFALVLCFGLRKTVNDFGAQVNGFASLGNRKFREDDKPKNTVQKLTYSIPHSRVENQNV